MATRLRLAKSLMLPKKKPKPQLLEAAKKTKWNILRGDTVQVIGRHPERGKQGIVIDVNRKADRVTVEGVNLSTYFQKGDAERGVKGRSIKKERSMHASNVNLVDPVTGMATRIYRKYLEDGTKVRVAKRSGAIIPRPEILSVRRRPVSQVVTDRCTVEEDVWEVTFEGR